MADRVLVKGVRFQEPNQVVIIDCIAMTSRFQQKVS